MKKIPAHTPEQWQAHVAAWKASGNTQEAYCKAHGLAPHNFRYWHTKLSRTAAPTPIPSRDTAHPALIPVAVIDDPLSSKERESDCVPIAATSAAISMHIGQRYRIEVMPGFDPATLRQVLGVLQE